MDTSQLAPLANQLRQLLGRDRVLTERSQLLVYECDAFTLERSTPNIVVLPDSTEEVAAVVRLCNEASVPYFPRGAGTSLSGGSLSVGGGVMIVLTRLNRILELHPRDRYALVETGAIAARLNAALADTGLHYAPDPSSQGACTIGGNVASNAGGPHTLKYGVTVNHILGVEAVTCDGRVLTLGGPAETHPGLDLLGALVGSEGTLAIVTKVWVRLTPIPQAYRTMLAVFNTIDDATNCISDIIGAGIIPAALEMMDHDILVAVEEAFGFGFPLDAEAVLIIEVDGLEAGLDQQQQRVVEKCHANQAREVRTADGDQQRAELWRSRKQAFGAIGRLSPSYCTQDGVVPRTRLPHILRKILEIGQKHDLRIVNVFHAGDGNVHPVLLFDERDPEQVQRVLRASGDILQECLDCGGTVTGEHGVGVEKIHFMEKMFTPDDLDAMRRLRSAWNPRGLLNPHKVLPLGGGSSPEQFHPAGEAPA